MPLDAPLFATSLVNPDDLARRRKIAEALMSVQPNPTNMWTGIQSAIGQIGGSLQETSLNAAEKAAQAGYGQEYSGLGDNPTRSQLEAIGGNPWGNSGQQAVVNALLGQNIQSTDPTTQADLALKAAQTGQISMDMNKPISVNRGFGQPEILVDPHTFKPVYDPLGDGSMGNGSPAGTTGSPTIDSSDPDYSAKLIPGAGGLTQAAIDQKALGYLTSGSPVPMGRSGPAGLQAAAISNRMAELNSSGNLAANKSKLTSLSQSLSQQQKYLDATERAFNTANDTLASLQTFMAANNINPSQFPDVNSFNNFLKAKGIDPGAAGGYNAQIATLRAEYSQVLAKGGVRSVETDNAAAKLIPDGLSPAALATVAAQIKVDGENVTTDAKNQVQQITDQINGLAGVTRGSATQDGSGAPANDAGWTAVPDMPGVRIRAK